MAATHSAAALAWTGADTTRRVRLAAGGAALLCLGVMTWTIGLLAGLPFVVLIGTAALLGLSLGLVAATLLSARLKDRSESLVHWDMHSSPKLVKGRVRHEQVDATAKVGRRPLSAVKAHASRGLSVGCVPVGPGRIGVELEAKTLGDCWIHGFTVRMESWAGLFHVSEYLPASQRFTTVPRRFAGNNAASLRSTRTAVYEHTGSTSRKRRGFGLEIRELRDFQAGDPFKHIAWRASARRGKLVSREFESDRVLSAQLLVDVSPSMSWGVPGETRLDYALDLAYELAANLIGDRDRAGLMLFDDRVRLKVQSGAGRSQLTRIVDALLEAPWLIHEDRTELSDIELVERVASFLSSQEGRSFELPDGLLTHTSMQLIRHDEARVIEHAQEALQVVALERARGPLVPFDSYSADYQRSILRAFCRHKGVDLPLDPSPVSRGQARGLEAAVHELIAARGGPFTVVVISDFYSANDLSALRRIAVALRRRRHSLVVLCPNDPAFDAANAAGRGPLEQAIIDVEQLRIRRHVAAAQAVLRPAGAVFLPVGPRDALQLVLARLRQAA